MYPIQFGFCVPIFAAPGGRFFRTPNYAALDTATTMALARRADALGYHSLWVADHLMLGEDDAILEGWTTLAALAGTTHQARLGLIHQAHFFRNPALAAKMGATLDQVSGGRFTYFADPAFGRAEHIAYGLPYPDAVEERIARNVEGVEIALALWQANEPVTYQGQYYQVNNAVCTPKPIQQPYPPIWFGEAHPHTLAACARYGQGWNSVPVDYPELKRRLDALSAACAEIARPVTEIERSYEVQILVVAEQSQLQARLQEMAALTPSLELPSEVRAFLEAETDVLPGAFTDHWIIGTPGEVETQLKRYMDLGISHFLLWFMDAPREEGLVLFAEEVMPRFAA